MWIMTMPIPDNAMKNHILKRISDKLKESDNFTVIGKDKISNEEGKRPIADFVLDLGLEEMKANYKICPWWFATNVTSTSASKYTMLN